jgi:hypothetical protein
MNGNGVPRISTPPQGKSEPSINTPGSAGRPSSPKTTPQANGKGTSAAQVIPSISSLVHATDSVSVISDNKSNSSRAGSKSPRRDENGDPKRTKDIPHDKLNSTEQDLRAIQSLNRSFMA